MELSQRDLICLCLDLYGHGLSGGQLRGYDPTLGVKSGVEFLASLDFVNEDRIGLIGHSLGAGAVRAASSFPGVWAVAFIGGGMGGGVQTAVGDLNTTTPRNLLMAVGSNDILFDVKSLKQDLALTFGTEKPVEQGILYGNKTQGTGRILTVSPTIHLLEPVDKVIVQSITQWMLTCLHYEKYVENNQLIYPQRDNANLITLLAFSLLILPLSQALWKVDNSYPQRGTENIILKYMVSWALMGLILFIPAMALGAVIPIPPQLFGSSLAWWLLVSGLIGWLLLRVKGKINSLTKIYSIFETKNVLLGIELFLILYSIAFLLENYYGIGIMFIVPFFRSLNIQRILVAPTYLPFFFVYFTAEGLYLHSNSISQKPSNWYEFLIPAAIKLIPYILFLFIQYGGMYFFNVRIVPGFLGFFLEFLWGIVPIFAITGIWSSWLKKVTGNIAAGVILNTLIVSWVAATTFPF